MSDATQLPSDELTQTLTLPGALLVADSTTLDTGNMQNIALKVLAHEFRKLRRERDDAISLVNEYYWIESRSAGKRADERAGKFLRRMGKL